MAKIGSGLVVVGLTLGALAAVTALAVQANGTEHTPASAPPPPSARASSTPSGPVQPTAERPTIAPVPAHSGTGHRVVYSLHAARVWLVDPAHKPEVVRTFTVQPSTVDPAPGSYRVSGRNPAVPGTDGRPIEHVVLFARSGGTPIGFSAAVDGTTPKPDPELRTGGIRETREDGRALWDFTLPNTKVVVVR